MLMLKMKLSKYFKQNANNNVLWQLTAGSTSAA